MKKHVALCLLIAALSLLSACAAAPESETRKQVSVLPEATSDLVQTTDSCDHAFGDWETVIPAQEEKEGLKKRICTRCGTEETEYIPTLAPHEHIYTETVYLADCTEDGFTQKICACGHEVKENVQPAPGHKYGDWELISQATYETEGTQSHTCSVCGAKETQSIPKIPKPAEPHVHTYTEMVYNPTCTTPGYTLKTCLCGDSSKTNTTEKLGHSYGEWRETLAPEGDYGGLERRDCEACGEVEMKTVPPEPSTDAPPTPDEFPDAPPDLPTDSESPSETGSEEEPDPDETADEDTPSEGTPPPREITYYSQRDERWGNEVLGCGIMKNNGCGPSAIAMAMSYFGIEVTPYDVALWLYENTIEFNHAFHGISGTGLKLGLEHYGRTVVPITTYEEFLEHLENGAVVVGCQGVGQFVSRAENSHCITMIGLNDGYVDCYDPYTPSKNGSYSAQSLWAERSTLEVDLRQEGVTHYAVY